jgi:hypothetical protein
MDNNRYKNEAAVRVRIVDRLLRTHADGTPYGNNEGASYRDMVEALVGLDKATKKELAIPDSLLHDETLYHAARLRMQKTLESICDAYAATHKLTLDRKAKKSRTDIRKELLVEIPRRKETGCKLFRYRNRDYSVIESGDYEKYLSEGKSPVFVKVYPSVTDSLALLKKAQIILKETEDRILKQFILIRVSGNQRILYKKKSNWETESMKNLEEAIQAAMKTLNPSARMETAKLLYSFAALLILTGNKKKAKVHLEEVLRLCENVRTTEANTLFVMAKQLLSQINDSREEILSVYSSSFSLWKLPLPPMKLQRVPYLQHQQQVVIPDLVGPKSPYMMIKILHPTRLSATRPYGVLSSGLISLDNHPILSHRQKVMIKGIAKKYGTHGRSKSMLLLMER